MAGYKLGTVELTSEQEEYLKRKKEETKASMASMVRALIQSAIEQEKEVSRLIERG